MEINFCIVNAENVIENIIVADVDFAESIGAFPYYEGANIGDVYSPPEPEPEPEPEPTAEELIDIFLGVSNNG